MSHLKNPSELPPQQTFTGMLYGQPGIGKSTVALSAPKPVMIDADKGMRRVEPKFRTPSLPMTSFKEVLELESSGELAPFETIVIDTAGRFVDFIGAWAMEENPKNRTGSILSQKGWGVVGVEFMAFNNRLRSSGKNVLYVAHQKEVRDNDLTKLRPDIAGSSGNNLIKDLDFIGYMEKRGDKRVISFNPDETFYAKNSLKLPQYLEVPSTDNAPNDFLIRNIVQRTAERALEEAAQNAAYSQLLQTLYQTIDGIRDVDGANSALAGIKATPHIWDSEILAKRRLADRAKLYDLSFDREAGGFKHVPLKAVQQAVA